MTTGHDKALAVELEGYRTDRWAVEALLERELLTRLVWDPCCGLMDMANPIRKAGYDVFATDIHAWVPMTPEHDFFDVMPNTILRADEFTIMMNPPFSLSVEFLRRAFELGARKIVVFQRHAWLESNGREHFWERYPPNRMYICGSRAVCWRFDIDPTNPRSEEGRKLNAGSMAHAWFVYEPGQPQGTLTGHIYNRERN